jgi:hypothetical protein
MLNRENFKIEEPLHQCKTFKILKWFSQFSSCARNWKNDLKSYPKIVKPFLRNMKRKTLKHLPTLNQFVDFNRFYSFETIFIILLKNAKSKNLDNQKKYRTVKT